ncbi:MAG: hypothetical protein HKP61_22425 [Dactylosporangium sp.]|nr:hypothetical protein [Dactylosporangium sp.]
MMAVLPGGHPLPPTARVDPVPGTPFGVAFLRVPRIPSGAAIGGLVAGIASVLISFVTGCFGVAVGQGVLIGGAFAILAVALGGGGIGLGLVGLRQTRRDPGQVTGRGMAIAGMSCGGGGVLLTVLAMIGAAAIAAAG